MSRPASGALAREVVARELIARGWEARLRFPDGERFGPGCWHWGGARQSAGYPVVKLEGRTVLLTRFVLRIVRGRPLPDGRLALHTCDTPACINPEHLRPGTHRENLADAWARTRRGRPRTFTTKDVP